MVPAVALPAALLLVVSAAGLAATFTTARPEATARSLPVSRTVAESGAAEQTAATAQPAAPEPVFSGDDRMVLTPAQGESARLSGLWPARLRSLLNVREPLGHGDFVWNDEAVPPGEITVRVDLRTQLISVFRGGHEIGTAVILYGADSHLTPLGTFPVMARMRRHFSSTYDGAPMPFTLRLTGDGVAIHGSDVRQGAATHGCIGVPIAFAQKLFDEAQVGDRVLIVRSPAVKTTHPA